MIPKEGVRNLLPEMYGSTMADYPFCPMCLKYYNKEDIFGHYSKYCNLVDHSKNDKNDLLDEDPEDQDVLCQEQSTLDMF